MTHTGLLIGHLAAREATLYPCQASNICTFWKALGSMTCKVGSALLRNAQASVMYAQVQLAACAQYNI